MKCTPAWIVLVLAVAGAARGQCDVNEIQKMNPATGVDDHFGGSVGVSGDVAVIGSQDEDYGGWTNAGAAYFYRYDGSSWDSGQRKQLPLGIGTYARFGKAVAASGNLAIVGAPGLYDGVVFVYRDNGSDWILEALVTASDGATGDNFGWKVAVESPSRIVVGAPYDDDLGTTTGSVYVFRYDGSSWVEEDKFLPWDGGAYNYFGDAVAIHDDLIVVGAWGQNSNRGAAYVFRHDGVSWNADEKILSGDLATGDHLGMSVAVRDDPTGEWIAVGAHADDDLGSGSGSVYLFEYDKFGWVERHKLTAPDGGGVNHFFGVSVALRDEVLVVGASRAGIGGQAYMFEDDGSGQFHDRLTYQPRSSAVDDYFGASVATDGDFLVVGAAQNDDAADDAGAGYFFPATPALKLDARPTRVNPGDTLRFDVSFSQPGNFLGLAVIDIGGVPYFQFIRYGTFGYPSYRWTRSYLVPSGLSGLNIRLMAFAFDICDEVATSNPRGVVFN